MITISVIIPIAKDETEHQALLKSLPDDMEIILSSEGSRASSLNKGAKKANGEYLWFLHADSVVSNNAINTLYAAVQKTPNCLLYFDLAFEKDATQIMCLNAWGVQLRSRIFKVPFGDQGFCISKELFERSGGFPEGLEYGEDHVFVWQARQQGIKIKPVGATISTSARKYKKNGWLKTTLLHQYLWIKQAWPQWRKLKKGRAA